MKREVTAAVEAGRTEIAIRMIEWRARTRTIMTATGLSEDQVRRLYRQYCRGQVAERQRGRSPTLVTAYVRTQAQRYEASLLAGVLLVHGLFVGFKPKAWHGKPLLYAERFCDAYVEYLPLALYPPLGFEQAWYLARNLATLSGVSLKPCRACGAHFVRDDSDVRRQACPFCRQREQLARRDQLRKM